MKKNTIRLTEGELKKVISESVKRVLNEQYEDNDAYGAYEYNEPEMYDGFDNYEDEPYDFRTQDAEGIHQHKGKAIPNGWDRSFTMGKFNDADKNYKAYQYHPHIGDACEKIGDAMRIVSSINDVYEPKNGKMNLNNEIQKIRFLLNRAYAELRNFGYTIKEREFYV